jgi:hypothetical protein
MFDTLKDLFFSIYGALVVAALILDSFWCLFAYGLLGLSYPSAFVVTCIVVLYRRDRNRERAMMKADLQIDSERQSKAIEEYITLLGKRRKQKKRT